MNRIEELILQLPRDKQLIFLEKLKLAVIQKKIPESIKPIIDELKSEIINEIGERSVDGDKIVSGVSDTIEGVKSVIQSLEERMLNIKFPNEVSVNNFPTSFSIDNLPQESKEVIVSNIEQVAEQSWLTSRLESLNKQIKELTSYVKGDNLKVSVLNQKDPKINVVGGGGGIIPFQDGNGNARKALVDSTGVVQTSIGSSAIISTADGGVVIAENSTTTALNSGQTFTGVAKDVSGYSSIVVASKSDVAGTLYIEFSPDGTNWDSSLSFNVAANTNEVHRLSITRRYFRARYTNGSSDQGYFRLQAIAGNQTLLTSALNSSVQTDADAIVSRSVLMGHVNNGSYLNVPATTEGHLEIAVHSPRLPFGSIHTESLIPVFQGDGVYKFNDFIFSGTTSGSGSFGSTNSSLYVSSGTSLYAQAIVQSRKRLKYRAGQGVVGRFTASFTPPVPLSYQIAGLGHAEDGIYIGYVGNSFGILYSSYGVREIRRLTVTRGATANETAYVVLNGITTGISLSNANSANRTSWELANGNYPGWTATPIDGTVLFVRGSAGAAGSTFVFNSTTAGATFSLVTAGIGSSDNFIVQSQWNGDKLDGSGYSGVTIDPTKLNVFQTHIQYLGAGSITMFAEVNADDSNNPDFAPLHTLKLPNTLTNVSLSNPSLPFTMAVYSAGSTANLTVRSGSVAGFIEGKKVLHGARFSYINQTTSANATNFLPLFTIMNSRVFANRANQSVINIMSINGALKHNFPAVFYLIKNGTLIGNPNFETHSTDSVSLVDYASTGVTYTNNSSLLWTGHLGDTGEIDHEFVGNDYNAEEFTLQPGEWISLAVKTASGTATSVTGSINTREDQ